MLDKIMLPFIVFCVTCGGLLCVAGYTVWVLTDMFHATGD